jgi:hypothetical protein
VEQTIIGSQEQTTRENAASRRCDRAVMRFHVLLNLTTGPRSN